MVEEEPEYGDAQLMTWNPHVGRSPTGWDDYARRERERAQVAALQEDQRRRLDQQVNQRPAHGKAPDNFWSCASTACWATTAIFVLMLAAIIVVPITNWSGDIQTSASRTGYALSANSNKTHSAGDACSNIDPPNRLSKHGVLTVRPVPPTAACAEISCWACVLIRRHTHSCTSARRRAWAPPGRGCRAWPPARSSSTC